MRQITLFLLISIFFASCKKDRSTSNNCIVPEIVPFQPYSFPVWHPNGQMFGFNYTPLLSITQSGTPPCAWYFYSPKNDSTGFYIMNKDGTGLKRVTNFNLFAPSWSPDENWVAFSLGSNIYKMRFTGSAFDTANIIQLTTEGGNFHPSWTANSDTIYYDSNVGTNGQGYYVWKMASDSTGKSGLPNTGRQPFVGGNNKVYYIGAAQEIFFMNPDGSNQTKYSNNSFGVERPKYWQGQVFYEGNQIGVVSIMGARGVMLISPAVTYDISISGEIIYSKMEYDIMKYNKQIGTLWIMNADGSNNRQLTFNNF